MNLFSVLNVKQKVYSGFGLMAVLILVGSVIALYSLKATESSVNLIADDVQPAVLAATELQFNLEQANSSLGFYLLSVDETHKTNYLNSLANLDMALGKLQELSLVKDDPVMADHVKEIGAAVKKFKEFRDRILSFTANPLENQPAVKFAAQNLNPFAQQMLALTSNMIHAESDEQISSPRRKLLLDIEEMRYATSNVMNGVRAYLAFRQPTALQEINLYKEALDSVITKVKEQKELLTLDQADAIEQFQGVLSEFSSNLKEMIKLHSGEKWRLDSYMIRTEIGPLVSQVGHHVSKLVETLRKKASGTSHGLAVQVASAIGFLFVLLGAGVIVGGGAAFFISRSIVAPLLETKLAMEDIASGNGDLTKRIKISGNDEIAQLANAFNHFAGKVQNIVKEVMGITERVASASERMTVVTDETRKGADRQLQETDEVAIAVNEMAAAGQEVARNANSAADAAHNADIAADMGRQVVGQTIESIDSLASEVKEAKQVINRVENDSESIGGVLDVIRGIAEQTNLLALNAAIEAARAGEQGRGFAVVADEVRTLASRTQQSTAEIQAMIERLQNGTREAVNVMEQSSTMAEATVGQAAKAGTSLEEINAAVAIIKDLNSQIACSAEEQSSVAEEINQKVVRISDITDQTAAGTQQTASASNELNQLAETLKLLVGQFEV